MGMDQTVTFAATVPAWPVVAEILHRHGYPIQTRMIDGELAFPDEVPPETWRELRVGTPQGMITIRREADRVTLVTWGNADASLSQAWNALTWAFAAAGGGAVVLPAGTLDADHYRQSADLPPALREK